MRPQARETRASCRSRRLPGDGQAFEVVQEREGPLEEEFRGAFDLVGEVGGSATREAARGTQ